MMAGTIVTTPPKNAKSVTVDVILSNRMLPSRRVEASAIELNGWC